MTAILLQTMLIADQNPQPWQGAGDTNSLYVLIVSLVLALVAFVILMRVRW